MMSSRVITHAVLAGLCLVLCCKLGRSKISPVADASSARTASATASKDHLPGPLCKASGYCSLELQGGHYVGPLRSNLELKAALSALAFRNEIILTSESRIDSAAQFVSNFQTAGYGHALILTDSVRMCHHLTTLFDKIGCGWCPEPTLYDEGLSKMFDLYSQYPKVWMGARMIRQGYNVMVIDTGESLYLVVQHMLC